MNLSKTVFRFLLVIMTAFALLTGVLFLLQEPGTDAYVISAVSLCLQLSFVAVLAIALYFDWDPFAPFEETL